MKTSKIEELAYQIKQAKERNLPKPIVFLGAGASKTGDIPLAGEIVKDILSRYQDNPKVRSVRENDKTYPKLMECLEPFERNELLKGYIDRAKINVTHIYLAQLLNRGYIDYVLTVNFDNLMLRALALYNEFPPTYDMAILKDLTTTSFKEKSVLYLHGQHHGLWLLNTEEEMDKVKDFIPPILNKITNQRPWIFIGYSGDDPIFKHILDLGRFDNNLYWVCYYDNNPNDNVCKKLLNEPNKNAYVIKGFESDSFMLKLNQELDLPQPKIIDKPFSSLKTSLENIVDINDKEHFKGVKERLEIVKEQVDKAIEQFEKGDIKPKKDLMVESEKNQLKKEIIDIIIEQEVDEKVVAEIERKANKLNSREVNEQLASLYIEWGNKIYYEARLKKETSLYKQSIEKFEKAVSLDPEDAIAFNNWGNALTDLAKLTDNESLFEQSVEKYEEAVSLDPEYAIAFNNWGSALADLAKLTDDESLFKQSVKKYEKAVSLNPEFPLTFNNWGTALMDLAKLTANESLFKQSMEKHERAVSLDPEDALAFSNWGTALLELAKLTDDESLFKQSVEKYEKAVSLDPEYAIAFNNWGTALLELAKLTDDESLFKQSVEKYEKAVYLDPEYALAFNNWGTALMDLAELTDDESLFKQIFEKLHKAVELGGSTYNLACAYASSQKKRPALKNLENALKSGNQTVDFVENDDDWKDFFDDADFTKLLNKYRK